MYLQGGPKKTGMLVDMAITPPKSIHQKGEKLVGFRKLSINAAG